MGKISRFKRDRFLVDGEALATLTKQIWSTSQGSSVTDFALKGSESFPTIPLGSVETKGVRVMTGKSWRGDQDKRSQVMIQNLEKNPTTICVDSGAGESVCPVDFFPDYEMHQTEKVGNLYRAAGGQELRNMGRRGLNSRRMELRRQ